MYDPILIAEYFLKKGWEEGVSVSNMKLQKLIYFAHGLYLATHKDQPLINENVEAWRYGPVIPSVYHSFKHCGMRDIDRDSLVWAMMRVKSVGRLSDDVIKVLNKTWELLKDWTPIKLSKLTHLKNSPWDNTYKGSEGIQGVDISNKLISEYFRKNYFHKNQA